MSVATELQRIQQSRDTLRAKAIDLGIADSTAKLDTLATAYSNISNKGAVSAEVKEGETYTIPKGYHDGSGTVSGVAGGGNYSLQSKKVTPTKQQQNITPDEGSYGLSDVTVAPIPEIYQDVSSVTAGAADVLATKVIVDSTGAVTTGTMANNGAVDKTLDTSATANTTYTIPAGYHNGEGTVKIVTETKSATPTKSAQNISATAGKVLSTVTVEAIPDAYQDVTEVDAGAADVLDGKKIVTADGTVTTGTMANNGAVEESLNVNKTSVAIPAGYHNGEGAVSITLEEKTVTPTKSAQTITPATGKVLSKVSVEAIPDNFIDTTDADAVAAEILVGKTAYVNTVKVEGTMANNGDVSATIDGLTTSSVTIPAGYTSGGTVSLTNDIELALAAI